MSPFLLTRPTYTVRILAQCTVNRHFESQRSGGKSNYTIKKPLAFSPGWGDVIWAAPVRRLLALAALEVRPLRRLHVVRAAAVLGRQAAALAVRAVGRVEQVGAAAPVRVGARGGLLAAAEVSPLGFSLLFPRNRNSIFRKALLEKEVFSHLSVWAAAVLLKI